MNFSGGRNIAEREGGPKPSAPPAEDIDSSTETSSNVDTHCLSPLPPLSYAKQPPIDSHTIPPGCVGTKVGCKAGRRDARFSVPTWKICTRDISTQAPAFNPVLLTYRGCTDVFCCFFFTLFIAGWAAVGFFGHDRPGAYNLSSRPYLLFFDITKCISYATILTGCPTTQICVARCPTQYFSYLELQVLLRREDFLHKVHSSLVCDESVDKSQLTSLGAVQQKVKSGMCAAYTVTSSPVLGRCLPEILLEAGDTLGPLLNQEPTVKLTVPNASLNRLISSFGQGVGNAIPFDQSINRTGEIITGLSNSTAILQKVAMDLSHSWWQILALLGVAAVTSFLWTVAMRFLGGAMIWLSMVLFLLLLVCGSAYCWLRYIALSSAGALNDYTFQPSFALYFEMPRTWLVVGISLTSLLLLFVLIFLFIRSRITLAVALIGETSKALSCMLSTLFFPIFPFLLHLTVFALWAMITIWLASSGTENCRRQDPTNPHAMANGVPCPCSSLGEDPSCKYVNVTRHENTIMLLQAYNLFGCFWLSCFVSALGDMTLAGAFASYYFAFRKPRDVPALPVLGSMGRAVRHHMGTMAFGALVLSIVKFFQVVLDYIYSKLKGADNPVAKTIYNLLSCCFWCLEKFLRFLSRNAYIACAIYGKGFIPSARDSFMLLARNVVRVVVLGRTTALLLFIGKGVVVCGVGVLSFYYFSGRWVIDGLPQINLYYYFVPITIVVVGSYFICDLFFQVYETGVDTIFLCFLEDVDTNDGSAERPYYMSDSLKKILGKENKF